jgi:5,6-dimethylbenzimidazole synthase
LAGQNFPENSVPVAEIADLQKGGIFFKGVMMTPQYEMLMDLLLRRMSVRRFKPDPLPDGAIERILEAGRWAMSGANGQPWEYIVVTDPSVKEDLYQLYEEQLMNYNFWMEQLRMPELRHPAFQQTGSCEEQLKKIKARSGWGTAPALIVVLGDGRRQWATVMGGHTFGRHQSHLTDGLANSCTLMHLAAAALGLGSQWVTLQIEDGFKRLLNVPDVMTLHSIIAVGYPDVPRREGVRRPLDEIVHQNRYGLSRHMSDQQIVEYIRDLRTKTGPKYGKSSDPKNEPG